MSMRFKVIGVVTGVVVLAVVALGALIITQPAAAAAARADRANFGGGGFCGQTGLDAAAKALNMTSADLLTQLRGGATLSDLATKANVKLADVESAIYAACNAQTKAAIEAAVTAGNLTRDKADWLIQGLDKGYWGAGSSGPGFGFGPGFGGFGNFGFDRHGIGFGFGSDHRGPMATPTAAPSNTSIS